jgi:hypothetical protein
MGEIIGKHSLEKRFCEMYTLIINSKPDFKMSLSEDQVFSAFAPNQLKNSVSELFRKLKEQMSLLTHQIAPNSLNLPPDSLHLNSVSKIIAEKLEEIFYEDAGFNNMLI